MALIVDKSLFYAGTSGLDISAVLQKQVSAALFGGEGLFQTRIKGTGIAVLYSPVPVNEVQEIKLNLKAFIIFCAVGGRDRPLGLDY